MLRCAALRWCMWLTVPRAPHRSMWRISHTKSLLHTTTASVSSRTISAVPTTQWSHALTMCLRRSSQASGRKGFGMCVRKTEEVRDLKGKAPRAIDECGYAFSFKNIRQNNLAGASLRHRIANALLGLPSSSLIMEYIARQSPHHPRRAFHSISHAARVFWFLGGLVFVTSQWRSWSWLFV